MHSRPKPASALFDWLSGNGRFQSLPPQGEGTYYMSGPSVLEPRGLKE